ncbi:MAG: site-2 protease family protein [Archaeoglobaceae archaeon]
MQSSFKVFTIAGIEIRIHFTLFIILIILSYLLYFNPFPFGFAEAGFSESVKIALSIASAIGLFVAVLLHELSHSLLSKRSGVEVKGILLFIFGGVSMLEKFPKEPEKEISIAIVGPLTSFAIAAVAYLIFLTGIPIVAEFFMVFFYFNVVLGAFNLIPAFPLDGGRVLRGFIARKTNFIKATQVAAGVGKSLAIFMAIVGIFANPWLILIALFIYLGASEEERTATMENVLSDSRVRDVMSSPAVTVTPDTTAEDVINLMFKHRHLGYPVTEDSELVGIVTLQDVANASRDSLVKDLMKTEVTTITPDMTSLESFRIMNENKIGRLPVVSDTGELQGIVSRTDLMRILEVVEAIRSGE